MTVKGIEVSGTIYDNEDETARDTATQASQTATTASQTATQASETATQASQTATEASQSVAELSTTVANHTQQIKSLDNNKASLLNLELEADSDLTAESFTQMVETAIGDYPSHDVISITLRLNGHTFAATEGTDIQGDYVIFSAVGMAWNSDLPDPIFWAGTYGTYILFQSSTTLPTFGHFAFMWGNALDSDDPSLATVYFD